ncbi:RagB/SusD family nutrient uptake outer membrane protein [Chitinophaga sedimenti]|uniref:RagB/SusD family nutrient uptake outer membrane protein n=1 Tax=Chitinophaga sedimenti TaxID=2033606 RepID=UPI00200478D8|nr:RagB/SusD family nutrient uptake outer membrane protein [Chitinophaga sedimenti]MCK7553712.1 RagB/SusD family nutrient uptake outer membrane protein [Chitinophaga sedimenti]
MKKYLILLFATATFTSCANLLDEEPRAIDAGNFYNTPAEVEAGLNAIYTPTRGSGVMGALYECQQEIYAEYLYGRGSHAPLNDYTGLDNTNITRTGDMWSAFYQAIRNANIVIQKAPLGKQLTPVQVQQYVAEARFMRGLSYFFLVRNWAGVPLRTEFNIDSIELARSTQAQVYDFLVADLLAAEKDLPDAPRAIGAPSKLVAKTVLADVYMNMGQYGPARDKALEVITANKFALVEVTTANDFDKLFGPEANGTSEEIFT